MVYHFTRKRTNRVKSSSHDFQKSSRINHGFAPTFCRVHCINLLEETINYKNITETMKQNGTEASIVKDFEDTFNKLESLLNTTGCRDQICESLETYIPESSQEFNDFNKESYLILQARRKINCKGGPMDKECYLWYMIGDNKTSIKDFNQTIVNAALENIDCDKKKDQICSPTWTFGGPPKPGPSSTITKPSICTSGGSPGGSSGPGGSPAPTRKKRQVPPSPPSGSGPSLPGSGGPDDQPPPVSTDFQQEALFLRSFMNFSTEVRSGVGHQLNTTFSSLTQKNVSSFITACTYKGGSCLGAEYFHEFSTAQFGNCFTFNSLYHLADDPYPRRRATLTGSLYGLSIEVFLDQENYMLKKLSKKAGARIVIHDPTLVPLPDEYGMDVQPNTATSIAIQLTNIKRLPDPYDSNCTKNWRDTAYNISDSFARYTLAVRYNYYLMRNHDFYLIFVRPVKGIAFKRRLLKDANVSIHSWFKQPLIQHSIKSLA